MEVHPMVADFREATIAALLEPACWRTSRTAVNKTEEFTSAIYRTM